MDWHDAAMAMAGLIGSGVALIHGVLLQRLMVRPIGELLATDHRVKGAIRRLLPPLLHFSTVAWFLGGLALITAALAGGEGAQLATGFFVGSLYLFGALVNLWATRGRHPGWMLMAAALVLIAAALIGRSG